MKQVMVERFGGPDVLVVVEAPTPVVAAGRVLVRLSSIGLNHAELMARRGEYRLVSGDPPFVPGLEGGGVIETVGDGVRDRHVGQRVILGLDAPRPRRQGQRPNGTYRTHYVVAAELTVAAPDAIPDEQLGAIWLAYLTAWGCLVWRQGIAPGQTVAMPAASSSVALAAAQIVKAHGCTAIGLTTSPSKVAAMRRMRECAFDHLVLTRDSAGQPTPWHNDIKQLTAGRGVDVFFDPVAAGAYLEAEIRCLAPGGVVWVYGLLGEPGRVDVSALIRKSASIRGWSNNALIAAGPEAMAAGYRHVLDGLAAGTYRQHVAATFPLDDVRRAHETMEQGAHVGKLVMVPG